MKQKCVFISDGTTPAGIACARLYLEEGWKVAAGCSREETAAAAAEGPGILPVTAEPDEPEELVKQAAGLLGGLDLLICTPAFPGEDQPENLTSGELDRWFHRIYRRTLLYYKAAAQEMIAGKTGGGIITVTSVSALRARAGDTLCGSLCAGLHRSIQSLALQLAPHGIRINAVAAGAIEAGDAIAARLPMGRAGKWAEVARTVKQLAEMPYTTGVAVTCDGGYTLAGMPESANGYGWDSGFIFRENSVPVERAAPKTMFVSGGSRGIGRGMVEEFARNGYDVAFTYHSKLEDAQEVAGKVRAMGRKVFFRQASMEQEGVTEEVMAWAVEVLGKLGVVICNAGLTIHTSLLKMTKEDIDFCCNLDYKSYLLCAREAVRHMKEYGLGGRILFITSSRGIRAYPEDPLYGGMKAALNRACESIALACCHDGITVNCIAPGNTAVRGNYSPQELQARPFQQKIPLGRAGTPVEVAGMALYLSSPAAAYITGCTFRMDGGLILPVMPEDAAAEAGPGWHELPPRLR